MKNSSKAIVILLALGIPLSAACAKTIKLAGTHSRTEIHNKCKQSGGLPYNTKGKSGKYGCDGLTNSNSIDCNSNGKCTATVPG
jgi:hypothetical protein